MDSKRRAYLIERYHDGVTAVVVAVEHLSEDQLDIRPAPKARTAREVVHHLSDAELHDSVRLRRMLVERMPVLVHWDEDRYAERLFYDTPVALALDAFRAMALLNIEILGRLNDEQWQREGNQQRPWTMTVESWLDDKVKHIHDCLMQILNAPSGGRAIPDPHELEKTRWFGFRQ